MEEEKDGKLICEQIISFEEAAGRKGGELFRSCYDRDGFRGGRQSGTSMRGKTDRRQSGTVVGRTDGRQNSVPEGIWIQFPNVGEYQVREQELFSAIADSDGNDDVVIYLRDTKTYKPLPPNRRVKADNKLRQKLTELFGQDNVKQVGGTK